MSVTPGVVQPSPAKFAARLVKLGISIVYFAAVGVVRHLRRIAGKKPAGSCVVLYYHNVPDKYRAQFQRQMETLAAGCHTGDLRTIELKDIGNLPAGSHSVAVTFDDALVSFAENAVPVLHRLGIPATVFALAGAMDCQPVWGESYFPEEERVMTAERLRNLPNNISVGSHTLTHADLTQLNASEAANEIGGSRQVLEKMLGRPVTLFSFPFGSYDESAVRLCVEAGYERVFTIEPALVRDADGAYVMGRVAADPWDWPLEFRLKISGAYCWQPYVQKMKKRIKTTLFAPPAAETRDSSVPRTSQRETESAANVARARS
jgi:peptidoglycan/xylan/chitin deacetylase (PgdA/CDA1 family)